MNILVTGGAGYIGSHTCVELLQADHNIVVVDNLQNSSIESLKRVEKITNKKITFYELDIRDKKAFKKVFEDNYFDGVIHFAGLKAVGESVKIPMEYYNVNVYGTFVLAELMKEFGCETLVFSSSATVYGEPNIVPIKEDFTLSPKNPYGRSKLIVETYLKDIFLENNSWHIGILRYFNPAGAHESGLIGEDPNGIPNNLIPYISQLAVGKFNKLKIFGGDYKTPDGTGIRDYIHVVDLAKGHVMALEALKKKSQIFIVNLGAGIGHSVLDMLKAFEKASSKKLPYEIVGRRQGDIPSSFTDTSFAEKILGWKPKYDQNKICEDAWRWQQNNPFGYK